MKLSESFFYTIREDVKDEESISGKLLVRSGMIRKSSSGVYMYMPLGFKVLTKIEEIVRDEMNKAGANELLMPSLLPEEVYVASGRRDKFGGDMFSLQDRYDRPYVLGPTHEELFVFAASQKIKSYKDMPFNLYQIGRKYRDEARPRFGLIRVREFLMKDAYSFDKDSDGMDVSYQKMFQAYQNIFNRLGIQYKIVRADCGAMGGSLSEEFQAVSDIGEDTLVLCSSCDYASNIEVSECVCDKKETREALLSLKLIHTPNIGTIQDLVEKLELPASHMVKTLVYQVDDAFYACLIPGDREINELKLQKLLHANEVTLAQEEDVVRITHAELGFAGPIGLDIPIVIDEDILYMHNFLVGANRSDYHYIHANVKDFSYQIVGDIKNVVEGDKCPKCGKPLFFKKGIEIGNTFKLETKYSRSLHLEFLDENNQLQPVFMGCYGIGIERVMAAIVEQCHDEKGIVWPSSIAPFQIGIVLIQPEDAKQKEVAYSIYEMLSQKGIDVLLDDRNARPGVKFNDMDLIGIPIRITVGKKAEENIVELKLRAGQESRDILLSALEEELKKLKITL